MSRLQELHRRCNHTQRTWAWFRLTHWWLYGGPDGKFHPDFPYQGFFDNGRVN